MFEASATAKALSRPTNIDLDGSTHPVKALLSTAEAFFGPQFDGGGKQRWWCQEVEGSLVVTDGRSYYALGRGSEIIAMDSEIIEQKRLAGEIGRLSLY